MTTTNKKHTRQFTELKASASMLTVLRTGVHLVFNRGFTQHYVIRKSTMFHNKITVEKIYGETVIGANRFRLDKNGMQQAIDQINEWRDT